jgi:hypothetical protein
VGLNTLRTQEILDESYVSLELYLFRDEQLLTVEGSDTYLYAASNGQRLGVGQPIGTAYSAGTAATVDPMLQQKLNAYGRRIRLMQTLGGIGTPSDVRDTAAEVDRDYLGLLDALEKGDLSAVDGYAVGMQDGINRYDILTGNLGDMSLPGLEAERDALVAGLPVVAELTAEQSGYFYYTCDGYEGSFHSAAALNMTPAEFFALTEQAAAGDDRHRRKLSRRGDVGHRDKQYLGDGQPVCHRKDAKGKGNGQIADTDGQSVQNALSECVVLHIGKRQAAFSPSFVMIFRQQMVPPPISRSPS